MASRTGVFGGDDIVYVPRNAADITLADPEEWGLLDTVTTPRGRSRHSSAAHHAAHRSRNHWESLLNARLAETVPLGGDQSLELIADLFNLPHLLDKDWGLQQALWAETFRCWSWSATTKRTSGGSTT